MLPGFNTFVLRRLIFSPYADIKLINMSIRKGLNDFMFRGDQSVLNIFSYRLNECNLDFGAIVRLDGLDRCCRIYWIDCAVFCVLTASVCVDNRVSL